MTQTEGESEAGASRRITPDELFAILRRIDRADSIDDLRDTLLAALMPYGFKGFTIAIDRKIKSLSVHAAIIATWQKGVNERYVSSGLFHKDPVMLRSHRATEPFVWDLSIFDTGRSDHAQLIAMRREIGVSGGIVVPVMESFGARTVLFISGEQFPSCETTLAMLRVILAHVVARLNLLRSGEGWQEPHTAFVRETALSVRERQVLGWIAFGKSSKEVAAIMGISEYTVNEHIASAVSKLDASNRTEAVMRAMLTNDIDLG